MEKKHFEIQQVSMEQLREVIHQMAPNGRSSTKMVIHGSPWIMRPSSHSFELLNAESHSLT